MAAIKRWLDRALGKLTPEPARRRRGSKWFAERRDWRMEYPTLYSHATFARMSGPKMKFRGWRCSGRMVSARIGGAP